jgi:hypothetical protein
MAENTFGPIDVRSIDFPTWLLCLAFTNSMAVIPRRGQPSTNKSGEVQLCWGQCTFLAACVGDELFTASFYYTPRPLGQGFFVAVCGAPEAERAV